MTDEFERRLRSSFQRAELPPAPDRLRAFVTSVPAMERARPQVRPLNDFLRLAAVLAAVAIVLGGMWVGYTSWLPALDPSPSPTPTASPSPTSPGPTLIPEQTPSPTASAIPLPSTSAELFAQWPSATILLERSVGPADAPVSEDPTVEHIDLEPRTVTLNGDLLLAAACLGPGELTLEVRMPAPLGGPDALPVIIRQCDGHPTHFTLPTFDAPWDVELVAVHVARGASWRLAVGELPPAAPAPSFEPIEGREGWWPFWSAESPGMVESEPGVGLAPIIPDDVTALSIYVQCSGEAPATVSVSRVEPTDVEPFEEEVACSTAEPFFVELQVTAGEALGVRVTPSEPAYVRLVTEVNALPVNTYGPVPELPAGMSDVPFVAAGAEYVALGTLGGERQVLVPQRAVSPDSMALDGRAALYLNTAEGSRVELVDVATGDLVRILAEHPAGFFIRSTWLDPGREQVFYSVINQAAERLELHRVAYDGSGQQRVLANAGGPGVQGASGLVLDEFIVDRCTSNMTCERSLIDATTLAVTTHAIGLDVEVCEFVGATESLVVWRTGFSCQAFGPDDLLIMSLDGTTRRTLPDVGPGRLVNGSQGWQMLYAESVGSEELHLLDLGTGESRALGRMPTGFVWVSNVRLPQDWVLFAPWYGIGDFPRSHLLAPVGEPPFLLNVMTGERIELVNLPH